MNEKRQPYIVAKNSLVSVNRKKSLFVWRTRGTLRKGGNISLKYLNKINTECLTRPWHKLSAARTLIENFEIYWITESNYTLTQIFSVHKEEHICHSTVQEINITMDGLLSFTSDQELKCVTLYHQTVPITQTQRNYHTTYARSPHSRKTILRWSHSIQDHDNVGNIKGFARPEQPSGQEQNAFNFLNWTPEQHITLSKARCIDCKALSSWFTSEPTPNFSVQNAYSSTAQDPWVHCTSWNC